MTKNELEWDKQSALEQAEGDEDFLNELLILFNETAAVDYSTLKIAFSEKNYEDLAASAHSIKGASASIGMVRLSTLARDMELMARQGVMPAVEDVDLLGKLLAAVQNLQ